MTADRCWNVARDGHEPTCRVAREEARERAREQAAVDRLLGDLHKVYGDRLVELDGWQDNELREAWGK